MFFIMKKYDDYFDFGIPYLSKEYRMWMVGDDGKSENVANAYISYIKSLDRKIFIHEEENFFERLKCYLDSENYDAVTTLFDKYLDIIDEWLGDTEKCHNADINQKKLKDWRSGFRNYRNFIEKCLISSFQEFTIIDETDSEQIFTEEDVDENQKDRDFKRLGSDIDVPYLSRVYKMWMVGDNGKSENVANSYISYIKSLDRNIFIHHKDFFELLKNNLDSENYDAVNTLFDDYLDIVDVCLEDAKNGGNIDINQKKISDWRSGFRNYRKFIEEFIIFLKDNSNIEDKDTSYKRIFAEDVFLVWMEFEDYKSRGTAMSYVSLLKRLNSVASEKYSAQLKGKNIFDLIPAFLSSGKGESALDLMMNLIQMLRTLIKCNDTSLMPVSAMKNTISAVNKYTDFLIEEFIDEVSDEEYKESIELHTNIGEGNVYTYGYDELENNFRFRLNTQNRMSNGKDVFYPISIIKRLFRLSDKVSSINGISENNYKWFNRWLDNCISDIVIATDKGRTTVGNLSRFDAIIINPETKEVYITLLSGETLRMLTSIDGDVSNTRYMSVDNLKDIHIGYNPLISSVLSENKSRLPALIRLTEIIKDIAKSNNLSIETGNFSNIAKKVFENREVLFEMIELVPNIKEELLFISDKSTLQLMEAGCNLRKK